jgi:hypothetical protein
MFNRYDNADKHTGTMEPGLIPVLHYVAEAKALVESDGVEKKDERDWDLPDSGQIRRRNRCLDKFKLLAPTIGSKGDTGTLWV